jgi:hypothetical protein
MGKQKSKKSDETNPPSATESLAADNKCLSIKTRSPDHKEIMFYLKFEKSYRSHEELIMALSFILQEKVQWTSPEKTHELLVDSPLH